MPESDRDRCAALAKWVGWKRIHRGNWVIIVPPNHRFLSDGGGYEITTEKISHKGPDDARLPAYDTNPANALELLDWLAKEPRGWHAVISMGHESTCVQYICPSEQYNPALSAKVNGPPSVAWTCAIFEAACEVMAAVKESEVSDV